MRKILLSFVSLFSSAFLLTLGTGLLGTLLSMRMSMQGMSAQTTGLVMSMFYAGLMLGAFWGPALVQQVGHIRSFVAFGSLTTACAMSHALFLHPVLWGGLRLITGFAVTGNYMVVESWLNARTEPQLRGRVMAIYMVLNYLGLGIGQLLLNVSDVSRSEPFVLAGILLCIALIPMAITRSANPDVPPALQFNVMRLYRMAPFSMFGCLTAGLVNGSFYALGPVFSLKMGLSVSQLAWFMGVTIFGGLFLQWPAGSLSDRFDRITVLSGLCIFLAVVSTGIWLVAERYLSILLVFSFIYGGIAFTIYPVAVAGAHDRLDPVEILPISSALILFYGAGAFMGPIVASSCMDLMGPAGLYAFIALTSISFGSVAYFSRKGRPSEIADQSPFVPLPRTSPLIAALDPRLKIIPKQPSPGAIPMDLH